METANVEINRNDFATFLNCIKLVSEANCTDCDIEEGVVRQTTNNRNSLIEIDLSSLIGSNDLPIADVKQVSSILKTFELVQGMEIDDELISVVLDDKSYVFRDVFSDCEIRRPLRKMLDNKFMNDTDFGNAVKMDEEQLVLSIDISSYMLKNRVKTLCMTLQQEVVTCEIDNGHANLVIKQQNNEKKYNVLKNIELNQPDELPKCHFKMFYLPFCYDIDGNVKLEVYKLSDEDLFCKFEQRYNGIPIKTYIKAKVL